MDRGVECGEELEELTCRFKIRITEEWNVAELMSKLTDKQIRLGKTRYTCP